MKKTYMTPEIEPVALHFKTNILISSDLRDAGLITAGTAGEVKEESGSGSGSHSIWDEEW